MASLPAVDPRLASALSEAVGAAKDNPYAVPTDRQPFLTGAAARKASVSAVKFYDGVTRAINDLNGSAIIIGSLSALLKSNPMEGDTVEALLSEAVRHTELLASMNRHAVQVSGYLLNLIVRQERERWTAPIDSRPELAGISKRLRDLPVGTQTLFPGGFELLQAEALESRERQELVARVLPPRAAETPKATTKAAKKKWSASPASSEKQPAPPPPAATQDAAGDGPATPKKWGDTLPPADKGRGRGRGKRK